MSAADLSPLDRRAERRAVSRTRDWLVEDLQGLAGQANNQGVTMTSDVAVPARADLTRLGLFPIDADVASSRITPQIAEALLETNTQNRSLSPPHVDHLAGAMRRGEWKQTGEPLQVTTDGQMLNRQHTLSAVVKSGVLIDLVVVVVEEDAQFFLDGGRARTFGDDLYIQGEDDPNTLAAAAAQVWAWEQNGVPVTQGHETPTRAQKQATLDRHPGLRDSRARSKKAWPLSQSMATSHHYIFSLVSHNGGESALADASFFFDKLRSGEGLKRGDAIHTLRERLIRMAHDSRTTLRGDAVVRSALVHRAWHAFMAGEFLSVLRFQAGAAHPDRFPVVEVDDIDQAIEDRAVAASGDAGGVVKSDRLDSGKRAVRHR